MRGAALLAQQEILMSKLTRLTLSSCALATTLAFGQTPAVLRDLEAQGRVTLTKEELT